MLGAESWLAPREHGPLRGLCFPLRAVREGRKMPKFEVVSKFEPMGDQPAAIDKLARDIGEGEKYNICWEPRVRARLLRLPKL